MKGMVSIIMATYNRAHLIEETLDSILNQSYSNFECLIIDDGGNDDTPLVIQGKVNNDSRFLFLKRTDSYKEGLSGCRNMGLDLAIGNYVVFFDDDDLVHPENLEVCVKELEMSQNIFYFKYKMQAFTLQQAISNYIPLNLYHCDLVGESILEDMIIGNEPFASCSVMWKKECFEVIRFNEQLHYAEEWECYSRILSLYPKGIVCNAVLYFNRKHQNSNTGEYYSQNNLRRMSKSKAIQLVGENLNATGLLSHKILNYLITYSIWLRQKTLLHALLKLSAKGFLHNKKFQVKFLLFPIWKKLKKLKKSFE